MKDVAVEKIRNLFDDIKRDKKTLIKILFIILILLTAVVLRIVEADRSSLNIETADTAAAESEEISGAEAAASLLCVDIGGQVANPGVYQVSEGTRLYQLIELAGGLTENADTDSINRASYVEDGEKIMIPAKVSAPDGSAGEESSSSNDADVSAGNSAAGPININIASKEELMTLNGIGDVTAEKIIEYRKSSRFKRRRTSNQSRVLVMGSLKRSRTISLARERGEFMKVESESRSMNEKMLFNPFMLGFDRANSVDSEKYRCYVFLVGVIRELLDECRINISSKGYLYIQDCVITIFDQRTMNIRFKTDVYPYVAFKYGIKDAANIEHSIRNAIVAAYKIYESDPYHSSTVMSSFGKRPTNKEFLLYMTSEVYRRLWHESVEFTRF